MGRPSPTLGLLALAGAASTGCYMSHERPLDPVACAPFVVSPEGVITTARGARFEARGDGVSLRSLGFAPYDTALMVMGEIENTSADVVCPDAAASSLVIDGTRVSSLELLGPSYAAGGATVTCLAPTERAYVRAFIDTYVATVSDIARVEYRFPIRPLTVTPHPAAPVLGEPRWAPYPGSPGYYQVEISVTMSVDVDWIGAHCVLMNTRCDVPVLDMVAGGGPSSDRRHFTILSQLESDVDPAGWTDRGVHCFAIPF